MTQFDKQTALRAMEAQGAADAQAFRARAIAQSLDGTAIIAEEDKIPAWRQGPYQTVGAPVQYEGQVYKVWLAHDSTGNAGWNPRDAVSLFDICHTKDPGKAKPYQAPSGSRGLYQKGECMVWTDGKIYASTMDNNAYTPESYAQGWKEA